MKPQTSHRKLFALAVTGLTIAGASSASAATTAYRNLILGDNPIAYYELDETTGTNAANSSSLGAAQDAGHNGTLNLGQASAHTFLGTSYDFAGGYAVAAAIPFSLTEWTMEAWVKYSSDKTSDSHIVSNDQGGWNDDVFFGINPEGGLLGAGAGTIGAGHQDNASSTRDYAGFAMSADTWHHVAVTASNTSGLLSVYIDGSLVVSNTNANSTWTFNGADGFGTGAHFTLGAKRSSGGNVYDGLLDELAIYDSVLSESDLAARANFDPNAIPEPSTTALLGLGGFALILRRRK